MCTDPLEQQVANHQRDLRIAAQRRALARSVRRHGRPAGRLRAAAAHLLIAAAARLQAPHQAYSLGENG